MEYFFVLGTNGYVARDYGHFKKITIRFIEKTKITYDILSSLEMEKYVIEKFENTNIFGFGEDYGHVFYKNKTFTKDEIESYRKISKFIKTDFFELKFIILTEYELLKMCNEFEEFEDADGFFGKDDIF